MSARSLNSFAPATGTQSGLQAPGGAAQRDSYGAEQTAVEAFVV